MPIPTQTEMFPIVLKLMGDGKERSRRLAKDEIKETLGLSEDECEKRTSSGVRVYESRVGWAVSYLMRAGMLENVSRGVYRISEYGMRCLKVNAGTDEFVREMNLVIARDNPWNITRSDDSAVDVKNGSEPCEAILGNEKSPHEVMGEAFAEIDSELRSTLIESILAKDFAFFEQLVVDLLVKMGYGEGRRTQLSNDGGVDGIIATDALGFDPIYVQAKRYAAGNSVSRPELQGFAGALGSISRGVFITTSTFAKNAVAWAERYPHATIVLIDGQKLADLMIKYDLGVLTERVYRIKRLDNDYFGE